MRLDVGRGKMYGWDDGTGSLAPPISYVNGFRTEFQWSSLSKPGQGRRLSPECLRFQWPYGSYCP